MIKKNYYLKLFFILYLCLFLIVIKYENSLYNFIIGNKKRNIGIIGYTNDNNIGNQLLKYSMDVLLKRFGFNSTLISIKTKKNIHINFLKKYLNIKEIKNFYTDIKKNDYDFIIVDSDQVWSYCFQYILEVGFLSFAKNWDIKKIVYGASLGYEHWNVSRKIINSAQKLIKQFSGVSVREEQSIETINKFLGIRPQFVLDPTFLLEKDDYLKIVRDFKTNLNINKDYLCVYILDKSTTKSNYINKVSQLLNYSVIDIKVRGKDFIEKFIYSINISKSVITDSFHGTVFSIIFNKPFLTFINKKRGKIRFDSLGKIFNIENRFIYPKKFEMSELNNFIMNPAINITNFNNLKEKSMDFLKKYLEISK